MSSSPTFDMIMGEPITAQESSMYPCVCAEPEHHTAAGGENNHHDDVVATVQVMVSDEIKTARVLSPTMAILPPRTDSTLSTATTSTTTSITRTTTTIVVNQRPPPPTPPPPLQQLSIHAVAYPNDLPLPDKVGGKCCGCCCDYRLATFCTNVWIAFSTLFLIYWQVIQLRLFEFQTPYDEEVFIPLRWYCNARNLSSGVVLCSTIGTILFGIRKFYLFWVAFHMVVLLVDYILHIILLYDLQQEVDLENTDGIPMIAFLVDPKWQAVAFGFYTLGLLYPHAGFAYELHTRIMTDANYYEREVYSCCCGRQDHCGRRKTWLDYQEEEEQQQQP